MKRFVWNEKYIKMLSKLQKPGWTIDSLAREVGVHAGQLRSVVYHLHRRGYIDMSREKNVFKLSLTELGLKITECLLKAQTLSREGITKKNPVKSKPGRPPKDKNIVKSEEEVVKQEGSGVEIQPPSQ